jgi:HEAT repeat protein
MGERSGKRKDPIPPGIGREEDVCAYMSLLDSDDPEARLEAVKALGRIGSPAKQAIPRFQAMLFQEKGWRLLKSVCESLVAVGADPHAIMLQLLDRMKSLDRGSQRAAAELLSIFGICAQSTLEAADMERALPDLLRILRESTEDARARCAIVRVLGEWQVRPEKVLPVIVDLLDKDAASTGAETMQAITNYGQAAMAYAPKIIQCLRSNLEVTIWCDAEEFLRTVGNSEEHADLVVSTLMVGLKAEDSAIRETSASVLGDFGEHGIPAIPILCEALNDENDQVRWEAADSLGRLGAYALLAVPDLIKARHHPDPALQVEADEALRKIAPDKYSSIILDESLTAQSTRPLPMSTVARYLGNRRCQVGDEPPFVIGEKEAKVLEALVELRAAEEPELIEKSRDDDAARRLRRIRKNFPQLAAHIVCPVKKGRGGYSTTIRRA